MTDGKNYDIVPKKNAKEVAWKYKRNYEEWKHFIYKCQKNSFVKKYLMELYDGKCQYCGKPIEDEDKLHIHHCSYENFCAFPEIIEQSRPTEKNPNRTIKTPNCEKCFNKHPKQFRKCMSYLVPVHSVCNYLINVRQKTSADTGTENDSRVEYTFRIDRELSEDLVNKMERMGITINRLMTDLIRMFLYGKGYEDGIGMDFKEMYEVTSADDYYKKTVEEKSNSISNEQGGIEEIDLDMTLKEINKLLAEFGNEKE